MAHKALAGISVVAVVADGVDEREFTVPVRRLRSEGAHVTVASLQRGTVRRARAAKVAGRFRAPLSIFDVAPQDADALFLPGGIRSADQLRQSARLQGWVRAFDDARKPIASLGHAAAVLISAGVVPGRALTSCRGIADDVRNAGGQWLDVPVVRDANWVSGRDADDIPVFNDAMVQLFASRASRTARPQRPWPRALAAALGAVGAIVGMGRLLR